MKNLQNLNYNMYDLLPRYIQDFVYESGWEDFRDIQKQAFEAVLKNNNNIILSAGTASGKTEAAFFPVLTSLERKPSNSIAVLYVSPLKALINDQFIRLEKILDKGNIGFHKWHGDVSSYQKKKLIQNPEGILQITVESLEMLVSRKSEQCKRMFCDLRYVIIDEMHYFMDSPRGVQLLGILERLQRIIGSIPLRIGISATLGDFSVAKRWISVGSKRESILIKDEHGKRKISIALRYFSPDNSFEIEDDDGWDSLYKYLFKMTYNHKSIIFTNSRAQSENIISRIRKYAADFGDEELFQVHHGDISATIREEVEKKMKESNLPYVTGATVTLEMGIDIGELGRVIQIDAPYSASSFTQRIGRCGRRGQKAEIIYVQTKECDVNFDYQMDFKLLHGIAILQLCLIEKWVEPIRFREKPFAILYHQTMLTIYNYGEISPPNLLQQILTMEIFSKVTQEEYRCLLNHLIEEKMIEQTETKSLRLTDEGAGQVGSYEFCTVFEKKLDWKVKEIEGKLLGTVQTVPKEEEEFVLAGWYWKIASIDWKKHEIYVKNTGRKNATKWENMGEFSIDDKVMDTMRTILMSKENYSYLDESAKQRLSLMRKYALSNKLLTEQIIRVNERVVIIMLWRGSTYQKKVSYALKYLEYMVSDEKYYLKVYLGPDGDMEQLRVDLNRILEGEIEQSNFKYSVREMIKEKYDEYLPEELLRIQFERDRL